MANMSDAEGTLQIHGMEQMDSATQQQFEKWLIDHLEIGEYATFIQSFNEDHVADFVATGRWWYDVNIKFFADWLSTEVNEGEVQRTTDPTTIKMMDLMVDHELNFEYDYIDREPGQFPDGFVEEHYLTRVYKEDGEYKTEVLEAESIEHELNKSNMIQFNMGTGFTTFEEAKQDPGMVDEFGDEDIYEDWLDEFEDGEYIYSDDLEEFVINA